MKDLVEWKDKPVKYLRDQVIDQLKFNLSKGHLEIEEFEQLVRLSLSTQSKKELQSLVADLPSKEVTTTLPLDLEAYSARDSVTSILSKVTKKGRWTPTKLLRVLTVLGEAEVDFCDVHLDEEITYISLDCWLGETTILVPEGINVISNVKTILASFHHQRERGIDPNSPTIVIEGKVVMGEVKVEERPLTSARLLNS